MLEYTIGHVMRIHLELDKTLYYCKQKQWHKFTPLLATQRVIGVMGLGVIGKNIALHLRHLGFFVKGFSKTKKHIDTIECYGAEQLEEFLQECMIVIMVLPNTPATKHIMNKQTLAYTPKGASLINIGRGSHIHEGDLLEAIKHNHISHAVCDVFDEEPLPPNHPFWQEPRILITPHHAGVTHIETALPHIKTILLHAQQQHYYPHGLVNLEHHY